MKSVLNIHWKEWCWSWNSNNLATWCEELTHWKRPWGWERLKAGGEGDDRGCDVWRASLTWQMWVWANSGCWWWTGKPGVLQSMGSQRAGHNWATELNFNFSSLQVPGLNTFLCLTVKLLCNVTPLNNINTLITHNGFFVVFSSNQWLEGDGAVSLPPKAPALRVTPKWEQVSELPLPPMKQWLTPN